MYYAYVCTYILCICTYVCICTYTCTLIQTVTCRFQGTIYQHKMTEWTLQEGFTVQRITRFAAIHVYTIVVATKVISHTQFIKCVNYIHTCAYVRMNIQVHTYITVNIDTYVQQIGNTCTHFDGTIVWVEDDLGQRYHLWSPVPTITAVDKDRELLLVQSRYHFQGHSQQLRYVQQPLCVLE